MNPANTTNEFTPVSAEELTQFEGGILLPNFTPPELALLPALKFFFAW